MEALNPRLMREDRRKIAVELIPADAAKLMERFRITKLYTREDIFVIRVISPTHIWIYPKRYFDAFEKMKRLFEEEYNNSRVKHLYQVPLEGVVSGLPCATFLQDHWARGYVTSRVDKYQVRINCVDYGITMQCSVRNVKYLQKRFMTLPALAILIGMSDVKPKFTED